MVGVSVWDVEKRQEGWKTRSWQKRKKTNTQPNKSKINLKILKVKLMIYKNKGYNDGIMLDLLDFSFFFLRCCSLALSLYFMDMSINYIES
jgi:hypothetical protein